MIWPRSEALMRLLFNYTYHSVTGGEIGRTGNVDPTMVPSAIFKAGDGKFLALACATHDQFKGLLNAMGKEELLKDERFTNNMERLKPENAKALNSIVTDWVKSKTMRRNYQCRKFKMRFLRRKWQTI